MDSIIIEISQSRNLVNKLDFWLFCMDSIIIYRSLILTQKEKKELYRYFIFVFDQREF